MTDADSQTCEHTEEEKRLASSMVPSQSSKSTKERLEYLKSHIMTVQQLTKEYEREGLIIPNADKFINSCEAITKKIDMHNGEEKINHLKDHVAALEDLTAEVYKDNLASKSFDDFLKSCVEFKQTLDQGKTQSKKIPNEGDTDMLNKINTAIELSKEAKEEGLISCSIDNFIKSCEHVKHLLKDHENETTAAKKPSASSVDIMKTLRCNINNMMDLMTKSKSKGTIKTNVDEFLKVCDSFKTKLNAKLANAGSQSDPCQCYICKSSKLEENKSFTSTCRMTGGEVFAPSKNKSIGTCTLHSVNSRNSCSCIECNCAMDTKASKSFPSLARIPEGEVFCNPKKKGDTSCIHFDQLCGCCSKCDKPVSIKNNRSFSDLQTKEKSIQSCQSKNKKDFLCEACCPKLHVTCNCVECVCDTDVKANQSFQSFGQMPGGEVFGPKVNECAVRANKNEQANLKAICCEPEKRVSKIESFHSLRRFSGGEVFVPNKNENDELCCGHSAKANEISEKRIGESKSFHSFGRITEDAISIRSAKHSNACGCVKCSCQPNMPIQATKSDSCNRMSGGEVVRKVISAIISNSINNLASAITSDKKCETCSVNEDKTMSGGEIYGQINQKEAASKNSSKKSFILRRFKKGDIDNASSSFVPKKSSKTVAIYNKCLGSIEKQVRKIIKISRVRNPDGTIREVKETITIKQKKHQVD